MSEEHISLAPKIIVHVNDYDPVEIGGTDKTSYIYEINFYSTLNSFALRADVTLKDVNNNLLNKLSEQIASKVVILFYELQDDPVGKIQEPQEKKVFQKTFSVDKIEVLSLGTTYPYSSDITIHLVDNFDSLILNKQKVYSNFNVEWDSEEMSPVNTIHALLKKYEKRCGKMYIDEKIFGVSTDSLKRRFATDQSTALRDVFQAYMDELYNTRWKEYLSPGQPELSIPKCLLAYTNQYKLDKTGMFRRRPWLTCANLLDNDPDDPLYSVPYPKTGRILDFAHRAYNINVEETSIELAGGPGAELKDRIIADTFRKYTFNPRVGNFINALYSLDEMNVLSPKSHPDIESHEKPKYWGVGDDPKFKQIENIVLKNYLKYPYNMKENQHYFSTGENSFYADACNLLLRPMVYVTIPYSAWHSPGQEVDLRMITTDYIDFQPDKDLFFSMNKLISGRWKIINTKTTFKQQKNTDSFLVEPRETLGLTRTRYFNGELPKQK